MLTHIRAGLWLLVLTVLVCCVLYPLALWAVGQGLFRSQAQGSLVEDEKGQVRGSRLIAQKFSDDRFFQPRPSAVDYNASASGASNWAASNPLLRDRAARQLGPVARYEDGKRVGPDIEKWFREQPGNLPVLVASAVGLMGSPRGHGPFLAASALFPGRLQPGLLGTWAKGHPELAKRWVKDDANKKAAVRWVKDHPESFPEWRGAALEDVPLDDVAVAVLTTFAAQHPGAWPVPKDGRFEAVKPGPTGTEEITDLQAVLFDVWLQAHPDAALRKVPADMVTASGSGLDPHITLRNARWQLEERVAGAWAKQTGRTRIEVFQEIDALLRRQAFLPFGGLAGGEELINVLGVNLELARRWPAPQGK